MDILSILNLKGIKDRKAIYFKICIIFKMKIRFIYRGAYIH